ncbi:MAG: NAD-dependent epimerase/dehydratase family protein [Planctomycetota bacterium]|nr:NAD-dependent epimerase/dehydratase family protein [Planctomycetota bacterium]
MRVLVIGGTGHIGSYLIPRLVQEGHDVSVVARHPRPQYTDPRLGWPLVRWVVADRIAEERDDTWAKRMQGMDVDAVIDLLCYTPEQNQVMYGAFRSRVSHFIHCGTVWAYGPPDRVPYEESFPRRPITDYGRNKARIEAFLHLKHRHEGFPVSIVHPGHISGRRWLPIDPQGSRDGVGVYERLASGREVYLPDQGAATIHHVHGDDVAQLIQCALDNPRPAMGESFSAVAPYALSLVGCCRAVAAMFGSKPNLKFIPLSEMSRHVGERSAGIIAEHVTHTPCASIAKAQRLLGYAPRYTTEQIYAECLEHWLESGQLVLPS